MESSITRVVGLELYQMTFPSMRGALDLAPTLRRIPEFLTRLRESFDLVMIASPPASRGADGRAAVALCRRQYPGAGSGRTRAPVAIELRDALSASGGVVVGAVLTTLPIIRAALPATVAVTRACMSWSSTTSIRRSWRVAPS